MQWTGSLSSRRGAARGATVALVVALVVAVLLSLLVSLLVLTSARGWLADRWGDWLAGAPDCVVSTGDRTVELDTEQAEAAARITAASVRLQLPTGTASPALADALDLSDRDARVVASALTGRTRHALTCTHGGSEVAEPDRLNRVGLTARAARVRRDLDDAFGRQRVGGFAPGGVSSGHMPGSAHYEGRAVDVFVRPISRANKIRGWAMAQYLVARARRLEVNTVIFDGHIWTARRADEGWRDYRPDTAGRSRAAAAVLEHRDHVHVDVAD